MVRQVRGLGTLTPEDIRWIPATTQGRVEKIILRPGTSVKPDSVILELSNPQLEQQLQDAELKLQAAEAGLANLQRAAAERPARQQRATAANIEADYNKAKMQAQMNEALGQRSARVGPRAEAVAGRRRSARRRATRLRRISSRARPNRRARRSPCSSRRSIRRAALLQLTRQQRDELKVRAGIDGMLQLVPVEVGQQVAPGTNLARVAEPEPPQGGNQDRGDAGQGHPARPEGRSRHAQRHRRGPRRAHRSVGAERHASPST